MIMNGNFDQSTLNELFFFTEFVTFYVKYLKLNKVQQYVAQKILINDLGTYLSKKLFEQISIWANIYLFLNYQLLLQKLKECEICFRNFVASA
jgi:hypothetical protein